MPIHSIYTNQNTVPYGAELIAWSGLVPEKYSEIAYGLFDIGIVGKAALALKTASQSHNIIKFSTLKTSGQIKPTDMRVTVENISLNQRNVIELKEVKDGLNFASDVKPNLKVNMNQQNKHIVGTNEHKTANMSSEIPRSTIDANIDVQKLVNDYAGTSLSLNSIQLGKAGSRERITGNKIIGNYYNVDIKTFEPTTNFTIHYSKTGVHIVPARPTK